MPAILHLKALCTRDFADVSVPSIPKAGEAVDGKGFTATKMHRLADRVTGASTGGKPTDGVMLMNWVKLADSAEDRASDEAYGMRVVTMLAQHGGGPKHIALNPTGDGSFDQIAGVHYPNRGFMETLLRSKWFLEGIQGKAPSDTICVCTTPFPRGLEAN